MKYLDYYAVLNLNQSAPAEQIKTAFRVLAKKYHPDVCGNSTASLIRFRNILEAYNTLSDTESRRIYDSYINNSPVLKN